MFQPSGQHYKNTDYKVKTKILQVEHTSTRHALNFEFLLFAQSGALTLQCAI